MPDRPTVQIRTIARINGETWAVAVPRIDPKGIDGGTLTTSSRTAALGIAHLVAQFLGVPAEVWDDGIAGWVCAHPDTDGLAHHEHHHQPEQEQP
jgi:hypothetical protein